MEHREKIAEEIALLLLSLKQDQWEPERTFEIVANEAASMAYRAHKAKTDPSWWHIGGKPHWNERMGRIKHKIETKA